MGPSPLSPRLIPPSLRLRAGYLGEAVCVCVCVSEWVLVDWCLQGGSVYFSIMYVCMLECVYGFVCRPRGVCMYESVCIHVNVCANASASLCITTCVCVCAYVCFAVTCVHLSRFCVR